MPEGYLTIAKSKVVEDGICENTGVNPYSTQAAKPSYEHCFCRGGKKTGWNVQLIGLASLAPMHARFLFFLELVMGVWSAVFPSVFGKTQDHYSLSFLK
jgi:hypothetical protein